MASGLHHAGHEADLAGTHADIAGRHVRVRTQVAVQFDHQSLAETHDFGVGLAFGVEVGAALAAAHGQRRQRVLEGLLEGQKFQDGEVHRGVKPHAALVGADGRAVLNAEAAIDLDLAGVVHPADAELQGAFRLDEAFEQRLAGVARVLLDEGPQAVHDFFHSLHEFGLMRVPGLNPGEELIDGR